MKALSRSQKHRARKKRRIAFLMKQQDGRCYWCDGEMTPTMPAVRGKAFPLTMATVDHLRDKFNPKRREPSDGVTQRWVMACWECNHERGKAVSASQPIEVLRARAGQQQDARQ